MQIAYLIIEKLTQFFLMMLMGAAVVRTGVLNKKDLKVVSALCIYIIMPCAVIKSFQVAYTQETIDGLRLSFIAAVGIDIVYVLFVHLLHKFFRMNNVEKASVLYPNVGILVIPLVSYVLGEEWVIYSTGYLSVQTILLFTHAQALVSGERNFNFKAILKNINIIAVVIGFLMFVTGFRLPDAVYETVSQVSGLLGPISMISVGMLVGGMNLKKIFGILRVYRIVFVRLIIMPLLYLGIIRFGHLYEISENADMIFYISLLAAMMPTATTITQFAQVFSSWEDTETAGAINVISTLLCLITIPLLTWLYWVII